MSYKENIFTKIIDNSLESKKLYEDEILLIIEDIKPIAPIHLLIMPKVRYKDYEDFVSNAKPEDIVYFFKKISEFAKDKKIKNYRLISNKGALAGQIIFHFHIHLISEFTNMKLNHEKI